MKKLLSVIAVFLFLGSFAFDHGQDDDAKYLRHEFQDKDRTVYLNFGPRILFVWSINGEGDCMVFPRTVKYEGNTIRFPGGTEWEIKSSTDSTMTLEFPKGREFMYVEADRSPKVLCGKKGDQEI